MAMDLEKRMPQYEQGVTAYDGFRDGYAACAADAAKVIRRIMHTLPGVVLSDSVAEAIEKLASPARGGAEAGESSE